MPGKTGKDGRYCYSYPRPSLCADVVLFTWWQNKLQLLLIRRGQDPFSGHWALPGGFVGIDETPHHAASRELEEETGLKVSELRQVKAYGAVERDPRTRVISMAFWGVLAPQDMLAAVQGDDAQDVGWFPCERLPELAFDHSLIIGDAVDALRWRARHFSFGRSWLESPFTANALAQMYSGVLGQRVSSRRLLNRLRRRKVVVPAGETAGRNLYRFAEGAYRKFENACLDPEPY